MNKVILLANRPVGKPSASDFKFEEIEMPSPKEGEVLLKTTYVSVDPYLRGRMSDAKSYVAPFELNKPMSSAIIAEVTASKNPDFKVGDYITAGLDWKLFQTSNGKGITKVDPSVSLSAYLGALGMTGLTALMGLQEIGKPKSGETLVVSGAAGAVGSIVGQIGKIMGCRVIGIAGSDEKTEALKSKFGFDEAINYKTTENMQEAIATAAPDGVDIYFDNVGGDISDAVIFNMNKYGRIAICGTISSYNDTEASTGPRLQPYVLKNSMLMQGFIVSNYAEKFPEGVKQLSEWLKAGKLQYSETIVNGFDQIPQAFMDLFEGKNEGKMVVKI
ncbi:NADP-dependent oxidoreductase [Pedobacter sp. SAFR-022]|uniref:NADP-dependent oxidoreductase n=1 Tax=Pedobacter sp. SAFR-022 TaxID=3436861 RepID=UPI003F7D4F22